MTAPGAAVVTVNPLDAHTAFVSDRSLDEFVAASAGSEESVDTASEADGDAHANPSVPTMRWSADGAACDDCGTVVSRRWTDGDAVVCADCKEW